MPSCAATPAHLALEIGLQVVVVEQHDVRSVAHRPERREVMHHGRRGRRGPAAGGGRLVDPQPEALDLRFGRLGRAVGQELGDVVEADRRVAGGEQRASKSMFAMWLSHDSATSRGSRPTQT